LGDGIAQIEAWASRSGKEFKPALRTGSCNGEIWIDLGTPEWNAVHITGKGCSVVKCPGVRFIRSGTLRPLPVPIRGGKIQELQSVLNVRPEDFVLVAAWLLQALNPEGAYPLISAEGESTNGKTTVCNMLLGLVDPNLTGLRSVKTENDLYIGAKNNHAVGFDNLSRMNATLADALCKISTGIAIGARKLYTDDEEYAFYARRPMVFNGIPTDLTERSDLATRTVRLRIPPIPANKKRGDRSLWDDFNDMKGRLFGALCDGLVGALRDWRTIEIEERARFADFEAFAEAGCRAMGFRAWAFVDRIGRTARDQ
jgi:putative DNA primase/helicase